MVKTAIFLGGFACGVAVSSVMTDEQRQMITSRLRPVVSGVRQPSRSAASPAPRTDVGPFTNGDGVIERQSAAVPTPS